MAHIDMEYLSKLFGTPARVKLLRLFLFNPDEVYDRDAVIKMARITPDTASKELTALTRAEVVVRKNFYKEVVHPGNKTPKKRKTIGWTLNVKYAHLSALTIFMRESLTVSNKEIAKRFRGGGTIKLLILSGFLVGKPEGELDVLIVGERLKEELIENAIRSLEAECGQEINYMMLSIEDYMYRRRVRDKMLRNIMDFEHVEVINKLSQ